MGKLLSKQDYSLNQARNIQQELYQRISRRRQQYQKVFQSIRKQKKQQILLADATQLVRMMDQKQATSVQIMYCFIQRTIKFGLPNNYVIDQMFQQAIQKAINCDLIRKQNLKMKNWKLGQDKSKCFPPFFGVPCSIKQTILLKGRQSYCGFVSKINPIPCQQTAYMQLILNMGLIPFVRSNVPQACKAVETNNNIFGYCFNPRNKFRSCGGSSGGQGGLVGSCCSPFGIGSDIGGSLRVPAQFNGLFTIKPSRRNDRQANAYYGKFCAGFPVTGQPGPLTRSTRDLITYCRFMFDQENYKQIQQSKIHPFLALKKFNNKLFSENKKMKIGYLSRLDTLKCSKSHQNAIKIVVQILQNMGHKTVICKLASFEQLYFFMLRLILCNNINSIMSQIRENQPYIKQYKVLQLISRIPWIIKRIIIWLIKKKQPRLSKILSLSKPLNCQQVMELIYQVKVKKAKQIRNIFIKQQLDLIIMPGFAVPAPKLGQIGGLQYCLAFNSGWNVLEYPAANMPVQLVKQQETHSFQDQYQDYYTNNMRKAIRGSQGMPVGIQIVALPKQQQKILYLMQQLEQQIKFNQKNQIKLDI